MKQHIGKIVRHTLLLSIAGLSALAAGAQTKQESVDAFAGDASLRHGSVGVAVMDLKSHQIVAGSNLDQAVITASTMKTLTSSTALEVLGATYRFTTPVYMVGELKGNHLKGDIVIVGQGDPTLGSKHFASNPNIVQEIIDSLNARGIKKIDGQILIDQSLYPYPPFSPKWEVEDLAWDYGAGIHALNFADNIVRLRFTNNGSKLTSVSMKPAVRGYNVESRINNSRSRYFTMNLDYDAPTITLGGRLKNGSHVYDIANPLPGVVLADSIESALHNNDINLKGKTVSRSEDCDSILLLEHKSPLLTNIISSLLERSDNMFTQGLLRTIALNTGRQPVDESGVEAVDSIWSAKGLDTKSLFMADGSGLARSGKASARFMVTMLDTMASRRYNGMRLVDLMPRVGVNARIGQRLPQSEINTRVAVKSGSMNHVQCYVGYFPADNPQYAWAVLTNNYNCTRADLRNKIDTLLINLFTEKKDEANDDKNSEVKEEK